MDENIIDKTINFLGIGGIGMSALARYFLQAGNHIYGYDLTPSDITAHLEELGATIHYEENDTVIRLDDLSAYDISWRYK